MSKEMFFRTKEAKICLNCNSLEMLDICVSLKDFGKGKDYKLTADVFSYTNGDEIDMHCSKCKSKNTVLIDTKIAHVINILNFKGYKTLFSCEGHETECSKSLPYITFVRHIPLFIFDNLPRGWYVGEYIKETKDITIYYNKGSDEDIDSVDIDFDEKALFNWALSLPDIKKNHDVVQKDIFLKLLLSKYFSEEKYWMCFSPEKAKTGHSHYGSPYETYNSCDNCDGAKCECCEDIIKPVYLEFSCPADLFAEGLSKIYGIDYDKSYHYAISDNKFELNRDGIFIPSSAMLKEYNPEFLYEISTSDKELFTKFDKIFESGENPYTFLQEAREKYEYMSNKYKHIYNQYVLWDSRREK